MISKCIPKWFMVSDIAFISGIIFSSKQNGYSVHFCPCSWGQRESLLMMCLESRSGPKFQEAGYEKYVEFANIWQYLVSNISPVWWKNVFWIADMLSFLAYLFNLTLRGKTRKGSWIDELRYDGWVRLWVFVGRADNKKTPDNKPGVSDWSPTEKKSGMFCEKDENRS